MAREKLDEELYLDSLDKEIEEELSYNDDEETQEEDVSETELEFNDKLITPSNRVDNIDTISRELLSTKLGDGTIKKILQYDMIHVKYGILASTQAMRKINFIRKLKEKIKRSKIYGFEFSVFERDFKGQSIGYDRVIHMLASTGKSLEGYNLNTIKSNFNYDKTQTKNINVEEIETNKKR